MLKVFLIVYPCIWVVLFLMAFPIEKGEAKEKLTNATKMAFFFTVLVLFFSFCSSPDYTDTGIRIGR